MANTTETRPRQGGCAVDRPAVLRKVMEVLSAKGFAKTSIADLRSATGLGYGTLHKAFGTRDEILGAAIGFAPTRRHAWPRSLCAYRRLAEKPFSRCWKRTCGYAGIGRDIAAAFYLQRLYRSSRRRRPAGLPNREASFALEAHPLAACAVREGRRTSRRRQLRDARKPLPYAPQRPHFSRS